MGRLYKLDRSALSLKRSAQCVTNDAAEDTTTNTICEFGQGVNGLAGH